jgi:hypothetical protein
LQEIIHQRFLDLELTGVLGLVAAIVTEGKQPSPGTIQRGRVLEALESR